MNKRLLLFNIIFYAITLTFYYQGKQDPSSSLGYGFFILGFWAVALLTLVILLTKKVIQPKTIVDKIGIVTATPTLCVVAVGLITKFNDTATSEWYFDKDHHRYKVLTFDYRETGNRKRIEFYKSSDTLNVSDPFANIDKWIKDSTWVYFSKSSDTTNIVKYRDDIQIK